MTVLMSPVYGAGAQLFTDTGLPLNGGLIYTYVAGSSTSAPTYNDNTGGVSNSNPIVLSASGRTPAEIWLTNGVFYKFIVTDSLGNQVGVAWDNIQGLVASTSPSGQWVDSGVTPTYINSTTFTVVGDQTAIFQVGRRLKSTVTSGTVYGTIIASVFSSVTTVTVSNDSTALDSGLSACSLGLITPVNTSFSGYDYPKAFTYIPTVYGSTSAGAGTYTTQRGDYQVFGNYLFFQAYVAYTAHTGTGNLGLTLPTSAVLGSETTTIPIVFQEFGTPLVNSGSYVLNLNNGSANGFLFHMDGYLTGLTFAGVSASGATMSVQGFYKWK